MSYALLESLNGQNDGIFKQWLSQWNGVTPRIAWYPSAGSDFNDVSYLYIEDADKTLDWLSRPECRQARENTDTDQPRHFRRPDLDPEFFKHHIFLHTDYYNWGNSLQFEVGTVLHEQGNTTIKIVGVEQLPDCVLPRNPNLISFPEGNDSNDKVFFMQLEIKRGNTTSHAPLIYAFVENTAFCAKVLLKHQAQLSHILHIRYGGGLGGGGSSRGVWLQQTLSTFNVEYYIVNNSGSDTGRLDHFSRHGMPFHLGGRSELQSYAELYFPELNQFLQEVEDQEIIATLFEEISEHQWSGYGNVKWLKLD
ncbi:MAG: hypothetical protein ABGY95_00315 [Rubritalea sp.]|uniref:DUF7663 domain-containing protein n=1 Tax=Rubritalea sp. TaxID=2109375 RepID=UPI003242F2C7